MVKPDRRAALGRIIAGTMLIFFGMPFAWAWVTLRLSALHPFMFAVTLLPLAGALLGLWLLVDGGLSWRAKGPEEEDSTSR